MTYPHSVQVDEDAGTVWIQWTERGIFQAVREGDPLESQYSNPAAFAAWPPNCNCSSGCDCCYDN